MTEWTKENVSGILQRIYNRGFHGDFVVPSDFPDWSFSCVKENECKFYVKGFDGPIVLKKGDSPK